MTAEVEDRELTDEEIRTHPEWHVCSCGRCGLAFAKDDESAETWVRVERLLKMGGTFVLHPEGWGTSSPGASNG